jgi:hypothetical protein
MGMYSGQCALVIDGSRFSNCSFAMEQNGSARGYGFLSAPRDVLERAQSAQRVEISTHDDSRFAITLLTSNHGISLFAFTETRIHLTLSSGNWMAVVESCDVREACILAEHQLREAALSVEQIHCDVLGGKDHEAVAIAEYIAGVQLSMIDPAHPSVSRIVDHARLEGSIRQAEQLLADQQQRAATISEKGWQDDLAFDLLQNLIVSLSLLRARREIIRCELMQTSNPRLRPGGHTNQRVRTHAADAAF